MIEWPESLSYWHWLAFGVLVMLVEVLVPGVIFLWLGIAAVLTGLAFAAIPSMSWEIQAVLFAVLSVLAIFVGRRVVSARQAPTDHPTLNRRGRTLLGSQHTLDAATSGGRGRVRIGDGVWRFAVRPQGHDLAAGTRIEVVDVEGTTLIVEAAAEG
ncbi:MAG: NfeD family protein [Rhodospirillaceae bacterium]|nr:NfeD family protein [Rhodospirillaceae bacterium]MDE0704829.1 NfeD family protein [Rhodospirillaceae bacterium]MXW90630.1 NfeD family protein [Rhodospirillaceae bacterium]MYB12709.1 NfeD family protein [Rhodospirillaceae bacterium]MYG52212.1 NfeD family protein [Rhodospirillaceae bacterium]